MSADDALDPFRVNPNGLDEALQQWRAVNWTIDSRGRKVPKQPSNPSRNAKSNDGSTWGSFDDALANAVEDPELGVGFPCAQPGHPFVFLDVDIPEGGEWVPELDRLGGAVAERSPSGNLRVLLRDCEKPEWWKNISLDGEDQPEVKIFVDSGYVTLTGDLLDGFELPIEATHSPALERWLKEAWEGFHEAFRDGDEAEPWIDEDQTALDEIEAQTPAREPDGDREEWLTEADVREALDHIDPDVHNDTWVRIGFALADFFDEQVARRLFVNWSKVGTKWDGEAKRRAPDIISRGSGADAGGSSQATIATVVELAKRGGWNLSTCPSAEAARAERAGAEDVEADGGTSTAAVESAIAPAESVELDRERDPDEPETLQKRLAELSELYELDDELEARKVVHKAALLITEEHSFLHPPENADAWRSRLYRYDPELGVYTPDGKRFVEELAERSLGAFLTNQQVNELVGKITRLSGVDKDELNTEPNRLVVGNGVLDLHTGELDPWTPAEYHRTKLDIAWPDEPERAECPAIDRFFHSLVAERDVPTLYQLAAHCLYKEYIDEKAAMLVGDGENGKSVFLDFLERFIGSENVSHRSLQHLDGNNFAANRLEGKLANFHTDMDSEKVKHLGTFKQLTGRDTIDADVKFEKPIAFENYATMVFSANRLPVLDEDTHGLWRRWIYLKFPNEFKKGSENYMPKQELMDEITDEAELQGLLVRCVDELSEWDDGRELFTHIDEPEQVRKKMKRASEPMYDFVSTCLTVDESATIPKEHVRLCYQRYAREENLPGIDKAHFGRQILNIPDYPIDECRPGSDERERAYRGVRLSSRGRQVLGLDGDQVDDEQVGLGDDGPQARRRTLIETLDELGAREEPIAKERAIGYALARGLGEAQATHAWDDLRDAGVIYQPPDESGAWMLSS